MFIFLFLFQINAWLRKLASDYPTIVTLESVDGTFEGRLIYGVKLEYPTSNRSRSVFIESAIHAREW